MEKTLLSVIPIYPTNILYDHRIICRALYFPSRMKEAESNHLLFWVAYSFIRSVFVQFVLFLHISADSMEIIFHLDQRF